MIVKKNPYKYSIRLPAELGRKVVDGGLPHHDVPLFLHRGDIAEHKEMRFKF
jgi:hypothetical protein